MDKGYVWQSEHEKENTYAFIKEDAFMNHFKLVSEYAPTGDQPQAIKRTGRGLSGR